MFFIVPDTDAPDAAQDAPAQTGDAKEEAAASYVNVELDLDDAPFLADEEEPVPVKEAPAEPTVEMPVAKETEKLSLKARLLALLQNKKLVIGVGASLVLLIGAAIGVNVFLGGEEAPAPVVEAVPVAPTPRTVVVPSAPPVVAAPAEPAYALEWEPFWIPLQGPEGEKVIFVCQFSIPTDDAVVNGEMQTKIIPLRDAVYYYFINKDVTTLLEQKDTIRNELLSVINEMLTSGKIKTLYFKDFYVADS